MAHDISNNVVAVLLVLVVVVSAFGTWAFLENFQPVPQGAQSSESGVQLSVAGAMTEDEADNSAGAGMQLQVAATEEN